MNKKALILISGVSTEEYTLKDLQEHSIYSKINKHFEKIIEFKYQYILDSMTIPIKFNRIYLDPARLKLDKVKKDIIRKSLQLEVNKLLYDGYEINLMCHSLGTWIAALTDIEVSNCWFMGSPIGFKGMIGRFIVRNDISFFPNTKPHLKVKDNFYNLYSDHDLIGHIANIPSNRKWEFGARYASEHNTHTSHDFKDYLTWFQKNLSWSIINA